jgi:hypothetical protein
MNTNRTERRKRVAMIRWVLRLPEMVADIHQEMWRLGFPELSTPADALRQLDDDMREALNYDVRIRRELPDLFHGTNPSEDTVERFNEVYPAFQREARACFKGLTDLRIFMAQGLQAPVEGGGTFSVPFRDIYLAIDIAEPKRIFKMAADEIAHCFSADEADEAKHGGGTVIEEYIVGDKFENISNSTIINRSKVERAFNRTEEKLGDEVASAILEIARHIDLSGNPAAGAVFDQFVQEAAEEEPDKSKLRQYWDGLVAILPDIVNLAGSAAAMSRLFS